MQRIKITIKEKPISKNRNKLYFDFNPGPQHPQTGKHYYKEDLHLTVFRNPRTQKTKTYNKMVWLIADLIRVKRIEGYHVDKIYISESIFEFLIYFSERANSKNPTWVTSWNHFIIFLSSFKEFPKTVTKEIILGFRDYLCNSKNKQKIIKSDTAYIYFIVFRQVLKGAFLEKILKNDFTNLPHNAL